MRRFPRLISNNLGHYVYLYIDPTNDEIFYVGKGNGNRAFSHLEDKSESKKVERINQIRQLNLEPKIELLVHGLDNESAKRVESSVIDLIGIDNLTNSYRGWKSGIYGRMTFDQLKHHYAKNKPVKIKIPAVLISIKDTFRYGMTPMELYDATRSSWIIGKEKRDTKNVKFAFAVFEYVIKEVYEIYGWFCAGSTMNTRKIEYNKSKFEFVGKIADDRIRNQYVNRPLEEDIKFPQQGIRIINFNK